MVNVVEVDHHYCSMMNWMVDDVLEIVDETNVEIEAYHNNHWKDRLHC